MIYTSTELFNAFLEDTRQIMVKVTIGNRVFDNDNIATLNLEYGSMDGGSLDIGGAFANSLKIGFSELVEGLKELDEIEIELGAVLPDETIEYVKMGTFIINEEVMMDRNNNTTSIDAMDRMVMLGEIYEPTLEGDYARIIDIAVDIANQAGVVVSNDFDRLRTDSIQIPREKTLREAIGIIAQFEVGFATFNRDGELAIRRLNDPDFDISPEDYTLKGLVKNEVPFRLNGIQCQIGDGEDDVLQTGASTGTQIVLNNPSMTQAHLDRIYTELSTLSYYPFSLDWYGHPALEAGDWIEIEDLQGNKFKTPNLHYTLDFNGGLKAKSQAETTSSSEVVYQYKSPLQQEIQTIAARLSASGGNHVYDDLTEPENPKEGDLWFKPEGPDTLILKYTRLEDGTLDWVEKLNTGDTTKNADAIEAAMEEVEEAKRQAKLDAEKAYDDARAHADAELERINTELSVDIGGAIELAEQAKQDAIDKANQAYEDAKAHADSEVQASKEHFDSLIEDVESDVADAQATADSAVEQIDTAVANAGFTSLDDTISSVRDIASGVKSELDVAIENAGFTSLDETVQNMTTITTNAEQRAQQAIDNASNAYGLAQTSISEAQTAQENSLTALGKADNALDGVSSLDVRVDDVEAELELKADNTFMNEDGTLTTLSNAITFNAHRFSSDMSRIESRVESLAGEINLVILRDAFEDKYLLGGETYPNPSNTNGGSATMRELVDVVPGESLALSKQTALGNNLWRINFYDSADNFIVRIYSSDNEYILTVPNGAVKMWVSYPGESQPQIVRGTTFVPYRPNMADQMTTDEVVMFRNEYDEFADKTERRLSTIDSSGGRLDTAELLITQTANGLALKADQTTVNELTGEVESLGTEFDVVAGQISSKVWKSDIDDIEIGGRNLVEGSSDEWTPYHVLVWQNPYTSRMLYTDKGLEKDSYVTLRVYIKVPAGERYSVCSRINIYREDWSLTSRSGNYIEPGNEGYSEITWRLPNDDEYTRITAGFDRTSAGNNDRVDFEFKEMKLEKGNKVTDWTPAPEDTDAKIDYVETEWTQTFDTFQQSVSDMDGRMNTRLQTIDNSLSAISDPTTGRLTIAEQTLNGFRNEVYNQDGSSKITQLATGLSSVVTNLDNLEIGGRNLLVESELIRRRVINDSTTYQGAGSSLGFFITPPKPIDSTKYLTASITVNGSENLRIMFLDSNLEKISYHVNSNELSHTWEVPDNAEYYVFSTYDRDGNKYKLEKGNKATDWTPAPEDTDAKIDYVETEWTQTFDTFSQTVSDNLGTVNTNIQTLENSLSSIADPETGRLSIVEQTANGLQSAVYNSDGSSKITQLATGINSFVGGINEKKNLIPSWEIGGINWQDGTENDTQTDRMRSGIITKKSKGNVFISFSLDGVAYNPYYIIRYNEKGDYVDYYFNERPNVTLTESTPYARIVVMGTDTNRKFQAEEGSNYTTYVPYVSDVSQTQIAQLADNINLRVTKGDVINQINVSTEGILIDGKKTHITGTTTIDDGVIENAHIADLDASKITAGTIDAARIDAKLIVAEGLEVDVIEAKHISADTATIDKLFADEANIDVLTSKTAFINSIEAVEIDASKITSGTIDAARIDAKFIVTEGLEVDVIEAEHIKADTAIIEKLFADEANIDVLTSKTAFINSIEAVEIDADKITSGTLDAGQITVVNLDVSSLSGNTAEFITASFNGINSSTQIDADGIYMSGSGVWRRTYLSSTGFHLYNAGTNKSGAMGYFKEHLDNTTSGEDYFAAVKDTKHYIGIGVNDTHHMAFGYQSDPSINRRYAKALQIDGDTGTVRLYTNLVSGNSTYGLRLRAYDGDGYYGTAWERDNSGILFNTNGTYIWDYGGNAWDRYNMTNRQRIGFYGDSGIQTLTTNKNMEIWTGGTTISFYTSINSQKFRISDGAIQAYTDIGMNGNIITGQSDERLKTNIRAREELIINKLKQFNFVDFDWIESGKSAFGLIAQQVQKFAPELVSMDETNMLTLNNTLLNMYTTKSVVEINQKVDDLSESTDDKIHKLQQELSKANRRIEELESVM